MLSKKHIDPCSCYLTVYITAKFINGHTQGQPNAHYFFSLSEGLNNGNKSAGHPEQLTVNIQATAMLWGYLQIRSFKNTLFKKRY